MPDDELLQVVRSWLDQHGYVLEMEVARELMPHCSNVIQGEQFTDPTTGKLRETDVLCAWEDEEHREGVSHVVEMVVECKSTTAPWIAFFGGSTEIDPSLFPYFTSGQWQDCVLCNDLDELYRLGPGDGARTAYAVTEKRNRKSERDHAREAILSVTSASIAEVRQGESFQDASPVHYSVRVLPLVVTKSPIVSCSLNDDGNVILSRINSCWALSIHEKRDMPVRVLVVTYPAFKNFVAELTAVYSRLGIK